MEGGYDLTKTYNWIKHTVIQKLQYRNCTELGGNFHHTQEAPIPYTWPAGDEALHAFFLRATNVDIGNKLHKNTYEHEIGIFR